MLAARVEPKNRRKFKPLILGQYQTAADTRGNCHFVDPGVAMLNAAGDPLPAMYQGDGVHLSRMGYRQLIDTLVVPVRNWLPRGG
jgi:hypothetical protein